eukprot:6056382-Pyramimonas_sp.AAC.1
MLTIAAYKYHDEDAVFAGAANVWQALYGLVRASSRRMAGYKRHQDDPETPGHAAWIKRRRLEVSELARDENVSTAEAVRLATEKAGSAWQPSHDKEETWQRAQRQIRFLETADQELVPDTIDGNLSTLVNAYRAHNDKLREGRNRADNAKGRLLSKSGAISVFGCRVHVEKDMMEPSEVQVALGKFHMRRASVDVDVDMFVVSNISNVGILKSWCALWNGARLATPSFFQSGGADGACFKYQPAVTINRSIWLSPKFIADFPALRRVLEHAASKLESKTKLVLDASVWASRAAKHPGNQARFVALVTEADKLASPGISRLKYALTPKECVRLLGKADQAASRHGMCKR